jgi:hypothetical protein
VNGCLNFFGFLLNVCASTALSALCFQLSQMKPMFHPLLLVRCDSEFHCHLCDLKSQRRTRDIFGTHLAQNLWLAYSNFYYLV